MVHMKIRQVFVSAYVQCSYSQCLACADFSRLAVCVELCLLIRESVFAFHEQEFTAEQANALSSFSNGIAYIFNTACIGIDLDSWIFSIYLAYSAFRRQFCLHPRLEVSLGSIVRRDDYLTVVGIEDSSFSVRNFCRAAAYACEDWNPFGLGDNAYVACGAAFFRHHSRYTG